MKVRTFSAAKWSLIALLVGLLCVLVLALWAKTQSSTPEEVTTSIAAPPAAPPREIASTTIDSTGNLIITYSDGSVTNVGKVKGDRGDRGEGLYPTTQQLDEALARYCADGRCDPRNPTQTQVLAAVGDYCADGACEGQRGDQGPAPTAEQLIAAVQAYCADGRCRGPTGPTGATGQAGADAPPHEMACVQRITNNVPTKYLAWKYKTEPNSAYRDLIKLPVWAECTAPVDLTGTAS